VAVSDRLKIPRQTTVGTVETEKSMLIDTFLLKSKLGYQGLAKAVPRESQGLCGASTYHSMESGCTLN
jgi:hypothetical protein